MFQTWEEFFSCYITSKLNAYYVSYTVFPVMGQDYKICSIGYIFATYLPHASCKYFCISKPDNGISQTETCNALVRHKMKMYSVYVVLDCYRHRLSSKHNGVPSLKIAITSK